ncbi:flavodoxin-dependent (E)-4-hydroxy-3-methylbut-2-enyl-diphosphate synthase [candidate division NPL-UPA2 bacterium]|nr:flavodoxin-dependent (E)-4-hydroxy-3-methylbut-2-enyl-diphosphate synthase [candidate division NPL-UPA2 bacterium]
MVKIGRLTVGGEAPVSVQSMTKTATRDVKATVRQIRGLEKVGCQIIRVAVPDKEAARCLGQIKKRIEIPLVADIHFDYRLALIAIEEGVDGLRLNPGNIRDKRKIKAIVKAARSARIPIRIGVNSGSLKRRYQSRAIPLRAQADYTLAGTGGLEFTSSPFPLPLGERIKVRGKRKFPYNRVTDYDLPRAMVESASDYIKLFEDLDFYDLIISLKASDVPTTIRAYRLMAERYDYPFHLGITAAGPPFSGAIRSALGLGILLSEGLGDTLRVSLTGDPRKEVKVGSEILRSLGLLQKGPVLISCPTCGRCQIDLIRIVDQVEKKLWTMDYACPPVFGRGRATFKVAVMGCVVNGPGEAREADIGIAGGKGFGVLFRKGKVIKKIPESKLVETILKEIKRKTHVGRR